MYRRQYSEPSMVGNKSPIRSILPFSCSWVRDLVPMGRSLADHLPTLVALPHLGTLLLRNRVGHTIEAKLAAFKLHLFLGTHAKTRGKICEADITLSTIVPNAPTGFQLTQFAALDDMWLYAQLISTAVQQCSAPGEAVTLVDLGSGSCAPTIKALLDHPDRPLVRVVAVDCDADAVAIGKTNVRLCKLDKRYQFVTADMLHSLNQLDISGKTIICANPPYLPLPPVPLNDRLPTLAIHGGVDGDAYLLPLLAHPLPVGTVVALQWSSLSNPLQVIDGIRSRYKVLHMAVHETPFGSYTGSEPIRSHLLSQRAKENGLGKLTAGYWRQGKFDS